MDKVMSRELLCILNATQKKKFTLQMNQMVASVSSSFNFFTRWNLSFSCSYHCCAYVCIFKKDVPLLRYTPPSTVSGKRRCDRRLFVCCACDVSAPVNGKLVEKMLRTNKKPVNWCQLVWMENANVSVLHQKCYVLLQQMKERCQHWDNEKYRHFIHIPGMHWAQMISRRNCSFNHFIINCSSWWNCRMFGNVVTHAGDNFPNLFSSFHMSRVRNEHIMLPKLIYCANTYSRMFPSVFLLLSESF